MELIYIAKVKYTSVDSFEPFNITCNLVFDPKHSRVHHQYADGSLGVSAFPDVKDEQEASWLLRHRYNKVYYVKEMIMFPPYITL
jgi:hypothetical protein